MKDFGEMIIDQTNKAIITVTPWLKRWTDDKQEYKNGWNDCVKEMRKNRIKYIKGVKKIYEESK